MKKKRSFKESFEQLAFSSTFKAPFKKRIKVYMLLLGLTLFVRISLLFLKNQSMLITMVLSGIIYCSIIILLILS